MSASVILVHFTGVGSSSMMITAPSGIFGAMVPWHGSNCNPFFSGSGRLGTLTGLGNPHIVQHLVRRVPVDRKLVLYKRFCVAEAFFSIWQ